MKLKRRLTWLVRPRESSLIVSMVVTITVSGFFALRLGVFAPGYHVYAVAWILLVGVALLTFVTAAHLGGILHAAWRWVWSKYLWTSLVALGALTALAAFGAYSSAPESVEESPPPMADGGLTVFASFPIEELGMAVHRTTVGVGSNARQVMIDLTFEAPTDQDLNVALVGSGPAAFDAAAVVSGAEGTTVELGDLAERRPDDPVQRVRLLPIQAAPDLLPITPSGYIPVDREEATAPMVQARWFQPSTATASVWALRLPPTDPGVPREVTLTWALRLHEASLTASGGDLGDVGCASSLDSVARASSGGGAPIDLIRVPRADEAEKIIWQVPDACQVSVIIGQINDHPVYLNGKLAGGAGTMTVDFKAKSAREESPIVGIDALTIPSTAYWVPELNRRSGDPVQFNVLVGICSASILGMLTLCGRALWRWTQRRPRARPAATVGMLRQRSESER